MVPVVVVSVHQRSILRCHRLDSPRSRSPACAKCCNKAGTLRGWHGSSGHYQLVNICTRTRVSSKPNLWSHSIGETSRSYIKSWKVTTSPPIIMGNFRLCGYKHIMLKRRSCAVGRSAQSVNTAYAVSSPCHGRYGTARKPVIVSERSHEQYCGNGMPITLTHLLERNGNLRKPRASQPLRCPTGLKIDGSGTEQQKLKMGK